MIIVDLSQVMVSNIMVQLGNHTNASIEENMVRHMVLNSLRSYKQKFGNEYGEFVIACDSTNYWRKQLFPYYKANRKKNIENSEINWKQIFECLNKIRSELKENFPYRVIEVETAEADDVIATLILKFGSENNQANEPILILSGDKDFIQLHTYKNVKQYDPVRKKWITHYDPNLFLKEHILKGDSGDGIPNILSADNCFVIGDRQKPLTSKRIEKYLNSDPSEYDELINRNYQRNLQLINLKLIPNEVKDKILNEYENQSNKTRSKLMNYFISNKLKNLMENINDF